MPHEQLLETWFRLGGFMRDRCGGASAHVLTGAPEPSGKLFLTLDRRGQRADMERA